MLTEIHEIMGRDEGLTLAFVLGTLGILAGTTIAVTSVVVTQWRMVRETEDMNALKHAMLDRGMTADEIAMVVEASSKSVWAKQIFAERAGQRGGRKWHSSDYEEPQPIA